MKKNSLLMIFCIFAAGCGTINNPVLMTDTPTALPATETAVPTSTPTPKPSPTPADPWLVPFLSRTPSEPIYLHYGKDMTISGLQFVDIDGIAITLDGCENITIRGNDFSNVVGAIYIYNSTNITVTWNRYQNVGDGTFGAGLSNFVQFNRSHGGYVAHNKGVGGVTEDIISIYKSSGISEEDPLIIEYNAFQGTDWVSDSGSGAMMGDGCGDHMIIRNNTFLSPGQSGIGIACGTDIHITDNIIYGQMRPGSNVGISIWNQYEGECSGNEIARNQVRWYGANGTQNPYWNAGNCGPVAGESTNNWYANIDPAQLEVVP